MKTRLSPHSTIVHLLARCLLAAALVTTGTGRQSARALGPLQALIDAAAAGSTVTVPAGIYTEYVTINKNLTLAGSPGAVVVIHPTVGHTAITLEAGAAEVTLRNLTIQNTSYTSGSGGAVNVTNSALTVDHCTFSGNRAAYGGAIFLAQGSLQVIDSSFLDNQAVYDGGSVFTRGLLTITNTLVKGNKSGRHGGGVHGDSGLVTINGSRFESNAASGNGGGLNMNDDLVINDTTFQYNTSEADGGGVLQWSEGKQIHLTNVTFADNTSKRAGGGMAAKGNMTVVGGSFLRNYAGDASVTVDTLGGGLYLEGGALALQGTTFDSNETRRTTGGFTQGGGLYLANPTGNQLTGAVFKGNKAWLGGGIYKTKRDSDGSYGSLTLLHSIFLNNEAGYGGGAEGNSVTARDCLFEGNSAANVGGGLDVGGNSVIERVRFLRNSTTYVGGKGAGLYLTGNVTLRNSAFVGNFNNATPASATGIGLLLTSIGTATLEHLTISNNTGGNGAGLQVTDGMITLTNAIIANQAVGVCQTGGTVSISGVLWFNNTGNTSGAGCTGTPSVDHALSGDPGFAADGYHITPESAAFNTAYNSTLADDIDGYPRPQYGQSDLGADEYWLMRFMLPAVLRPQ